MSGARRASPEAMGTDPLVRVAGISKRFPRRRTVWETMRRPLSRTWVQTLDNVSFDVLPGEFFGLLGHNGAGKTTLLKILATFIQPDEGTATICGHDVATDPDRVRPLVAPVVASERSLYWRLTARENLDLFGTLWRIPRADLSKRVNAVLEIVKLSDTGSALVGTFSTGMMQRLLIARALLSEPRVLLLDEPTRSLDPVAARDFRSFLRQELSEARGSAVLVATHSADEAFGMCDRVAVLHEGRVRAIGAPEVLRRALAGLEHVLLTRTPDHPALRPLVVRLGPASSSYPGVSVVLLNVPNHADSAAGLLRRLIQEGVDVVSFSPAEGSLASLLERAIGSREAS